MKVLNFGSLNIDMVYSVDHVVRPGETTASTELRCFCGGKGLNQSVALARAGVEVSHAGCVGADGDRLISLLRDNGVDTSLVTKSESPSGHAIIQVDRDGQNSILLFGGANMEITPEQIENAVRNFSTGGRLLLQNEINDISEIIGAAHARGMEIVFNPSPFGAEILSYPLENIDWFVVNETEAEELTGETEPEKILGVFSQKFPRASVLLTLGADGAFCRTKDGTFYCEIFSVPVVDTTAAGDTFLGFFFAMLERFGAERALKIASAASAVAVSRPGASASIPTLDEVKKFLEERGESLL